METRDRWLNPPELVVRAPEVWPGYPDRLVPKDEAAAGVLRRPTLTTLYSTPASAWLYGGLHAALDQAVAAAYDRPADLSDDEELRRLLELNQARS